MEKEAKFMPGENCLNIDLKAGCASVGYCIEESKLRHELKDPNLEDVSFISSVGSLLAKKDCGHLLNTQTRQEASKILRGD